MLSIFLAAVLTSIAIPECASPKLSYIYDARAVSVEGYSKTCFVCDDRVTIQTEAYGVAHRTTRPITLPELSEAMQAIQRAPTDEICDGPMDTGGTEYWLHTEPPVLFSAAGSACWIQSFAPQAVDMEALVDRFCGGVAMTP